MPTYNTKSKITYDSNFTFIDPWGNQKRQPAVHTVLKDAHINCIPVQEEDLMQLRNSLDEMTFSKFNIDVPSLLYGAAVSCFFSTALAYDSTNATPTIWGFAITLLTWIIAGFLSQSKKYKNNNEKNETHRNHAISTIDRVFRSSRKIR